MQSPGLLIEGALSVETVFAAVQGRLPLSHESVGGYSEIELANASELKRRLARGEWVIVSYTHRWLKAWDRVSRRLVDLTGLSLVASLVILFAGGALRLLPHNELAAAVAVFGGGTLAGLGLAARYSGISPPMVDHSVMVIDGQRRELIFACRLLIDEPVDRLIRVPMGEVALWFEWEQVADHHPDSVELRLGSPAAAAGAHCEWPDVLIAKVRLRGGAPLPEDLERQAQGLAQALGAQYLGSQGKPKW